jgi:ubiquinone/menaquinone biosynthesis C-methylase UbiE
MVHIKGLEGTFDTVVSKYEKMRPGYAPELYQTIFDYAPIGEDSRVVEVGSGSGQATLPVLQTGCELVSVEYGENFSKALREKFKDYPKFSVKTGKFEELDFPADTFDLVFSASAFHWVPEEIGYPKVLRILKQGGAFARFANHPYQAKDNPVLFEKIQNTYAEYYYPYYQRRPGKPGEYTEEQAAERAAIADRYGFTDTQYAVFRRVRTLSATEYRQLISTYSDHITIENGIRERFFDAIEDAINRHGGSISIFDTIDLQMARKP